MLVLSLALVTASVQAETPIPPRQPASVVAPGMVANGPAVVMSPARRGESIARLPVTHHSWGRLPATVEHSRYRLPAGALVYRTRFTSTEAMAGDVYDAWCGQGQIKRFFNFSDALICVVDTPDGRATLTEGVTQGAWWSPRSLASMYDNVRVDRPEPTPAPADAVPLIRDVKLSVIRDDYVYVGIATTGPDGDGSRTVGEPIVVVPLRGDVAVIPVAGHVLRTVLSADRSSMETTAALIDPALIDAAIRDSQARAQAARDLTPFVIGAVRVDVSAMTVTPGVVERRAVLASAPAMRARTGRVEREVRTSTGGARIAEGAIWHFVEQPDTGTEGIATQRGYWCGPGRIVSIIGSVASTFCAGEQASGLWRVYPADGQPWLVGTYLTTQPIVMYADALPVEDLAQDPLAPFRFQVVLRDLDDRRVRLLARGADESTSVPVWYGEFDWVDGQVSVPLWSHRLVLTRTGDGVTADLQPNPDPGMGLNSVGALPSPSIPPLW